MPTKVSFYTQGFLLITHMKSNKEVKKVVEIKVFPDFFLVDGRVQIHTNNY
jgi:hypothetical protein